MICGSHLFKNTKAELFIQKARARKIIVTKLRKFGRPVCYMVFKNSKIFCFLSSKSCF